MAEIITAEHGADGGHFYKKDGSPAYTVIGKNGKERNTTLRDARTNNLRPSVTEIIKLAAKLGLENWKAEQLLMSALTTSRKDGETEAEYIFRIKADAKEQSEKARERGTLIHSWVQSGFEGKSLTDEACKYFYSAKDELTTVIGVQEWKCELTFATSRYGGKMDLISDKYLIDIKTTDKSLEKPILYDDHFYQLGAYRMGVWNTIDPTHNIQCGILFVNSQTAEAKLIMAKEEDIVKGYKCFNALVDFYYAKSSLVFTD